LASDNLNRMRGRLMQLLEEEVYRAVQQAEGRENGDGAAGTGADRA
jgi:hypothetical protein